jgi:hypothetical protein
MVKGARRILFHLASLISLTLAVCAVGMILRARFVSDRWIWRAERLGSDGLVHVRWRALAFTGRNLIVQVSSVRFVPQDRRHHAPLPAERFTYDFWAPMAMHWPFRENLGTPNEVKTDWFNLGSAYAMTLSYEHPVPPYRTFELGLPLWVIGLLGAVLPVIWEIRYRRTLLRVMRGRKGLCPSCGYDLRATPQRCPECGRQTHREATRASRLPTSLRRRL